MNPAHLHLITNHIPVLGSVGILFVMLYGFVFKNDSIKKLGLVLAILVALTSIVAFKSGHKSEDIAEKFPGVTEHMIDEHEEAAELAFYTLEAVGGLALLALLACKKESIAKLLTLLVFLGSIAATVTMGRAAKLGGEIRHPEARPDFQIPASPEGTSGEHSHHHDD